MGDTSIIARRLKNGHVQYGWSGNGGYFKNIGNRLLWWYQSPKDVEYLFSLGATALIGQIGSENGGYGWFDTHSPTGETFSEGNTEREIFSELDFVDYGYFYDIDHRWYYVIPGPFRIKMPLELIKNRLTKMIMNLIFETKSRLRWSALYCKIIKNMILHLQTF